MAGKPRHGLSRTREYNIWANMKDRCFNPNSCNFPKYGGRGITVCDRWLSFENFIADMGFRPSESHSIERKSNDGDYTPDNCVWATPMEQQRNRRKSEFAGVRQIDNGRWRVQIPIKGKYKHIGYFDTQDEALKARQLAEQKYWKKDVSI